MKILLFGKNGQVGWELNHSLQPLGEIIALGREDADFSEPEMLRDVVREVNPDVIVNAAAYTKVDKAEEEEDVADRINGVAPGVLAEEALKANALLVHYSTDYVFDGSKKTPYVETDSPNPVSAYGRTKLAGELAIQSSGCDYLILRTSWVYSARGENFLLKILRLAGEMQELNVVNDQAGVPTWARTISDTTAKIIHASNMQRLTGRFTSGIYNVASSGVTTWFEFAQEIVNIASTLEAGVDLKVKQINGISSHAFQAKAQRPNYSVLSTEKIERMYGLSPVNWKGELTCCMTSIK